MLKVGENYNVIRTDIQYSRGINGIGFFEYFDAEVLKVNEDSVKIGYKVEDTNYYRVTVVPLARITQAVPYSPKREYWVKSQYNTQVPVTFSEEDYKYNLLKGVEVSTSR